MNTTGAGDAFIGGLAVAIQEGFSVVDMMRFAGAAGTLATTKLGA